jgi:hypothetical protein
MERIHHAFIIRCYYFYRNIEGWRFVMSRAIKWTLGIVSGLVALCALAVAGFLVFNRFSLNRAITARRGVMPFGGPRPLPLAPYQGMPDQGMPFRHFGGFSPWGFLGGWLIVAGAIGLFVLAAAALILVLRRPGQAVMVQPAAPVQAAAIPGGAGGPDQGAAELAGGNCPSCGREIQAEWSHCPYCGTALAGTS